MPEHDFCPVFYWEFYHFLTGMTLTWYVWYTVYIVCVCRHIVHTHVCVCIYIYMYICIYIYISKIMAWLYDTFFINRGVKFKAFEFITIFLYSLNFYVSIRYPLPQGRKDIHLYCLIKVLKFSFSQLSVIHLELVKFGLIFFLYSYPIIPALGSWNKWEAHVPQWWAVSIYVWLCFCSLDLFF